MTTQQTEWDRLLAQGEESYHQARTLVSEAERKAKECEKSATNLIERALQVMSTEMERIFQQQKRKESLYLGSILTSELLGRASSGPVFQTVEFYLTRNGVCYTFGNNNERTLLKEAETLPFNPEDIPVMDDRQSQQRIRTGVAILFKTNLEKMLAAKPSKA